MKKILFFIFIAATIKENFGFNVGEKLTYEVRKGILEKIVSEPLVLGKANLNLKETSYLGKEKCYHAIFDIRVNFSIKSELTSDSLILISASNYGQSYFTEDFSTRRFIRSIDEKLPWRKPKKEQITIDIKDSIAYYSDGSEIKVSPKVKDMISVCYFLRTVKDLEKKPFIFTWILAENRRKQGLLEIKNRGIEEIETKLGKFTCIKLEFLLEKTELFETENMILWLSLDERLPVAMSIEGLEFRLIKKEPS